MTTMPSEATAPVVRDASAEANEVLGEGFGGRVLEPSPPAIVDGEFFADDPVHSPVGGERVVAPVGGELAWSQVVAVRPEIEAWAAHRWLTPGRRLGSIPDGFVTGRTGLHRLAIYVIAPARHRVTGKFGLRWTLGGFGTPFFGSDRQIRVEGDRLVVQEDREANATSITSLSAAARFLDEEIDGETAAEHDSPPVGDIEADLGVRREVVEFLDAWWGMGTAALERLRADEVSVDPSRVQMWPGHFDPAIEVGDEDRRASYGASPGDATSDEPYLYVSVWWPDRLRLDADDTFWNADGYVGARLGYHELTAAEDPVSVAAEFWRAGRDRLIGSAKVSSS